MLADISSADLLTPIQREFVETVINGEMKNIFLTGCAGSGKTVVAALTAKTLKTKRNKSVQLLTYTKFLKKYIRDHFGRKNQDLTDDINHYHEWIKFTDSTTKDELAIVDECQDFSREMIQKTIDRSNYQIWCGDFNQQIFGSTFNDSGFDSILNMKLNQSGTNSFHFDTNFRNSIAIAQLAKCFITFNNTVDKEQSLKEKQMKFIRPIIDNVEQRDVSRNQPNTIIEASNSQDEYAQIAKKIKYIQENEKGYKQIAIVAAHHGLLNEIGQNLSSEGIEFERYYPLKSNESEPNIDLANPNLVLLCPIHTMKGFECDYLFFPKTEEVHQNFDRFYHQEEDDYREAYSLSSHQRETLINNLLFMLFTRAKKRIFCSYVNKNDSIVHKALEKYVTDNNVQRHIQYIKSDNVYEDLKSENQIERDIKQDKIDLDNDWIFNDPEEEYFARNNQQENEHDDENLEEFLEF